MITYFLESRTHMDEDIREAFEVFDREGKGHFNVSELAEAFNKVTALQRIPSNEVTDILKGADGDGDSFIRYKGELRKQAAK